ncbi:MAG: hypothetical protein WC789_14500 [Lentisphaeria bacterium]
MKRDEIMQWARLILRRTRHRGDDMDLVQMPLAVAVAMAGAYTVQVQTPGGLTALMEQSECRPCRGNGEDCSNRGAKAQAVCMKAWGERCPLQWSRPPEMQKPPEGGSRSPSAVADEAADTVPGDGGGVKDGDAPADEGGRDCFRFGGRCTKPLGQPCLEPYATSCGWHADTPPSGGNKEA